VVWKVVLGAAAGVVAGALGTVAHGGHRPWGLVAALALVVSTATMARAWAGRQVLGGHVVGLAVTLVILARTGPGGDVLIPSGGGLGWVWLVGAVLMAALVAVAPGWLFADRAPEPVAEDRSD